MSHLLPPACLLGSGTPSLEYRGTSLAIPGQMNGLVSERVAHYVVLKVMGLGLTLKWDMKVSNETVATGTLRNVIS